MADSKLQSFTLTIAQSAQVTDIINKSNFTIVGIEVPASMTSTAMTFKVGKDSSSLVEVRQTDNTALSYTISSTAGAYPLDAKYTAGFPYFQIAVGSAEAAARTLTVYGYKI